MSWWIFPTTADVGIRSFSDTLESIIRETTLGIQEYQLLVPISDLSSLVRHTSAWAVPIIGNDLERGSDENFAGFNAALFRKLPLSAPATAAHNLG